MISRIRVEGHGASAAEVESTLQVAASLIYAALDDTIAGVTRENILKPDGEMVIERDLIEPFGSSYTFKGRMLLHLNVADDSRQIEVLEEHGVNVTKWTPAEYQPVTARGVVEDDLAAVRQ